MSNATTFKTTVLALLALVVLTAGCGDDHDSAGSTANAADAAFINDMTSHHQGAIDMARLAQDRAGHAEIKTLAGNIITSQEAEIGEFESMREAMNSMHDGGDHMDMSESEMGMDMDMDALETAKPFDRAFMDAMIPHHQGAIAMAKKVLAEGKDPELRRMAQAMIDAQSKEIVQMQMWRNQWYDSGGAMGMGG